MWLVYAIIANFFMALVNYLDEYLTHSNTSKCQLSVHKNIGGVFLTSTFLCAIGSGVLFMLTDILVINNFGLLVSILSAIPMLIVWGGYFYLFQIYSAHQVVPLFGLSSIWLLIIELLAGSSITIIPAVGIVILILGSYLLDNGSLKWKIPSKLLFWMSLISLSWAITVYLVKIASTQNSAITVYFWQSTTIFFLGIFLFLIVTPYRKGFLQRIKQEGWKFIIPSIMNESCSQLSFLLSTIAVSLAPLAVYVTAAGGVQSLMLLGIFALFPLEERNTVTKGQWVAVVMISFGIYLLEI